MSYFYNGDDDSKYKQDLWREYYGWRIMDKIFEEAMDFLDEFYDNKDNPEKARRILKKWLRKFKVPYKELSREELVALAKYIDAAIYDLKGEYNYDVYEAESMFPITEYNEYGEDTVWDIENEDLPEAREIVREIIGKEIEDFMKDPGKWMD